MSRMRVLGAVALFGVAIVAALFALQRRSNHGAAAPLVDAQGEAVPSSDEAGLDTAGTEEHAKDGGSDRAEVAAPSDGVRDPQAASPRLRFAVVDARTLQPVEDLAFRVCAPKSDELANTARFEGLFPFDVNGATYAGGICELPEDESCRGYQIEAPGYANQEGWIEDAARTPNGQTIRLERGGSISGRVLFDGKPASNVSARLRPASLGEPGARAAKRDLSDFLGAHAIGRLKDGELLLPDLATGTYRLEFRAAHGVSLVLDRVGVVAGTDTSVGELRLASNPVVNGVVLFPANRIPPKYKVTVTSADQIAAARIDAEGKFTVDTLPAGHWEFDAPGCAGFVGPGAPITADLGPGANPEVTIDLRDRFGAWLNVTVRVKGEPAKGLKVFSGADDSQPTDSDITDSSGKVRQWVSAADSCSVRVDSDTGWSIASRIVDIRSAAGADVDLEFDLDAGRLTVDFSELSKSIDVANASLALARLPQTPSGRTQRHAISMRAHSSPELDSRHDFGFMPVAEYEVSIIARREPSAGQDPGLMYLRKFSIRAGELNEVRFTEADRVK